MSHFRKSSYTKKEFFNGKHRFEHWYRDNTVYFITSKVRDGAHAFMSREARDVFWERFDHYTSRYRFYPWVTTPLSNHYHTLGYLPYGDDPGPMMQHIHGSVAKLVNDCSPRAWPRSGAIAIATTSTGAFATSFKPLARTATRFLQAVRAKLVERWEDYADTHVNVLMEPAIARAVELNAFLEKIPYARYDSKRRGR